MTDQAFNPYEPPSMEIDEIPQKALGSSEYRIEKNTLVFREPCRLPQVCFWSGEVSDLTDCEFQIRVMPRWWVFAMPILIFGQQILVVPLMIFIAPMLSGPNSQMSPVLIGIMIGAGPGTLMVLFIGLMRYVGRLVTVSGSYSEDSYLIRRSRLRKVIFAVAGAISLILASVWLLYGGPVIVIAFLLLSIVLGVFISLRLRKPWAYISGVLTKDGDIVISGLRPEFFQTLRQLQSIAFQSDDKPV